MSGITVPWDTIVHRADPERQRDMTREKQYEFKNKTFLGDDRKNGIHSPRAPRNVRRPTITGAPVARTVIACEAGEHIGSPDPTITRQWYANGFVMPGEDDERLSLMDVDAGAYITCAVTASNGIGSPVTTTTAAFGPIVAAP